MSVSLIHSMSAFCEARSNFIAIGYVRPEILNMCDSLGLEPYPEAEGVKMGDVEFR